MSRTESDLSRIDRQSSGEITPKIGGFAFKLTDISRDQIVPIRENNLIQKDFIGSEIQQIADIVSESDLYKIQAEYIRANKNTMTVEDAARFLGLSQKNSNQKNTNSDIYGEGIFQVNDEIGDDINNGRENNGLWEKFFNKTRIKMTAWLLAGILSGTPVMSLAAKPIVESTTKTPSTGINVKYDTEGNIIVDNKLVDDLRVELKTPDSTLSVDNVPKDAIISILEKDNEQSVAPFEKILRELGCENEGRIRICAQGMLAWKNSSELSPNMVLKTEGSNKLQTYISYDQIINYALTGEGLNVIENENGEPIVFLVNCNIKMEKAFRSTIDWYKENGAENILDFFKNNGICIFCPLVYSMEDDLCATYNEYGVIYANYSENKIKQTKSSVIENRLKDIIITESFGSAHRRLMKSLNTVYDWASAEAVKGFLASYCNRRLFNKTKVNWYTVLADKMESNGIVGAEKMGNGAATSWYIKKQLLWITQFNLIKPLGIDNWDFLSEKYMEKYIDF